MGQGQAALLTTPQPSRDVRFSALVLPSVVRRHVRSDHRKVDGVGFESQTPIDAPPGEPTNRICDLRMTGLVEPHGREVPIRMAGTPASRRRRRRASPISRCTLRVGCETVRVFALGGTGRVGRVAAKVLAQDSVVTEIAIAGRDLAIARRVSAEIGPKAVAVEADAVDEPRLARIVEPYDLVVNTAGPDFRVALPAIRAAIAAGTQYCDIAADGPSTEKALSLDEEAKEAGVTALTGIGHMPGASNLLMRHAANQLDAVEGVRLCVWLALSRETYKVMGDPAEMRMSGRRRLWSETIAPPRSGVGRPARSRIPRRAGPRRMRRRRGLPRPRRHHGPARPRAGCFRGP